MDYKNNAQAPAGINPPVEMYSAESGYTYIAEKHSEKILSSTDLSQDVNIISLFDKTEQESNILASNLNDSKRLNSGTSFLACQSSTRIFLRRKDGKLPSAELLAKAQEMGFRAVVNFAPDQRNSFGMFKLAKHFPIVSGTGLQATGVVSSLSSGNDSASSNIVEIPIPWQSRATLNAKIYLPKWEDTDTELIVCTILSGRVTEGPAQ